ncbi:MAG: hypothetical protein V1647_07255 [Pseudomonadota bacterium]
MKKNFLFTMFLLAAGLVGCSAFEQESGKRIAIQIPAEQASATEEAPPLPSLNLEQEVVNCSEGSSGCSVEEITEPFDNSGGTKFRINSLIIVSDETILTDQNTNSAPGIRFQLQNIDDRNINSLTYSYEKRDNTGNVLVQNPPQTLYRTGDFYAVALHSSTIGSGILTSAPYEKHVITVRLATSANLKYSFDIEFYVYSHASNPVLFERKNDVLDSSYYKMDVENLDPVIDVIEIQNTLPYPVTVSSDVRISNDTMAVLSDTYYQQQKTYAPKIDFYPWDSWNVHVTQNVKYHLAEAAPVFSIKVYRGENGEDIPTTSSYSNNETILSYSGLYLQGNEKIRLHVLAHMDVNTYILGSHGQKELYEGVTLCDNISPASMCNCYYFTANRHCTSQLQANILYGLYMCGGFNLALRNIPYSSCGNPVNSCITKNVDLIYYPLDTYSLAGRHHTTNITYVLTSWLTGYENYDELGTTVKTMDTLDASKGVTTPSLIDLSQSFSGYIPGVL